MNINRAGSGREGQHDVEYFREHLLPEASLLTAKVCLSAGGKRELPVPDRADQLEPREARNTEEKQQENAEGEPAAPGCVGRGRRPALAGSWGFSLREDGASRRRSWLSPAHSFRPPSVPCRQQLVPCGAGWPSGGAAALGRESPWHRLLPGVGGSSAGVLPRQGRDRGETAWLGQNGGTGSTAASPCSLGAWGGHGRWCVGRPGPVAVPGSVAKPRLLLPWGLGAGAVP